MLFPCIFFSHGAFVCWGLPCVAAVGRLFRCVGGAVRSEHEHAHVAEVRAENRKWFRASHEMTLSRLEERRPLQLHMPTFFNALHVT